MTFYFFDLETSGFSGRYDRIMQFGGQRTDMDLKLVGKPDNLLVKMTPDILPEPGAVLVHGITPQRTLDEGITEAEFTKYLTSQVFTPDTIAVGYNNIRFDNEFIRFTLWRNFNDAYEWAWKDGRSSWDLLDVVRMTRALRPEGIKWPFAPDGKPTNSLGYLTSVNKLDHSDAHDALSDVNAAIALARLLKQKQPKLFDYLLNLKGKREVRALVGKGDPVVYTSGRYPSDFNKTTVAVMAAEKDDKSGALMYDLRIDPEQFSKLPAAKLAERWAARGEDAAYFPVKSLGYNKCPALAPIEVLSAGNGYEKLSLHKDVVEQHLKKLRAAGDFGDKLLKALDIMWPKRPAELLSDPQKADSLLYDGFVSDQDKTRMSVVRAAAPGELSKLTGGFNDERLKALLPQYKARNYPQALDGKEKQAWQEFRRTKMLDGGRAERFFSALDEIAAASGLDSKSKALLSDLQDYANSVLPKN